ncbi:MAG: hypothetical protein ACUVS1_06160 [Actinomycetota bacterium]
MAIYVNGRELEEHGLLGMSEARRRAGLYTDGLLRILGRSARDELADSRCAIVGEVQELNRALYESGANLEPPADLSREGERKGRVESFLRRLQTRFIRAVCEGYVQQQQLFNSYLSRGLTLCFLQVYGRVEEVPLEGEAGLDPRSFFWSEWDRATLEGLVEACAGASCLVLGIPGVDFLERLQEKAHLVMALDSREEEVVKAQGRMLPAWHGTRFQELIDLVGREPEVLLLAVPEILPALELKGLVEWAAAVLPPGGRILVASDNRFHGGIMDREGSLRPHSPAFLAAIMERHGFRLNILRLGERAFLEGRKAGDPRKGEGDHPSAEVGNG